MSLELRNWLVTVAVLLGLVGLPQLGWAQGRIESPEEASVQSGQALVRGWVCTANVVEVAVDDLPRVAVPYKVPRGDTQSACGDADNGFVALVNWNDVTTGLHTLRVYADGVLLGQVAFVSTSLGLGSFPRGLSGQFPITDFPLLGQTVEIEWRESAQNFVLRNGEGSGGNEQQSPSGRLESPEVGKIQSGQDLVRGWVCTASVVEVELDNLPRLAVPYKIPRGDTQSTCGDADNGFVALVNWNDVTPGAHTLRAYADGVLFASVEFHVTSLGLGSFPQGLDKAATLPNFPQAGTSVHVRWQESRQNFGLEGVLQAGQSENLCGTQSSQILDQNGTPGSVEVSNPCTPTGDILGFDPSVPVQVTGSATQRQMRSVEVPLRLCATDIVIVQGSQRFTAQDFRWVDGQGNEITCREVQPGQSVPSFIIVKSGVDLNFNEPFQVQVAQAPIATFSSTAPPLLRVEKAGTAGGHVSSSPAGISCGLDCTESYASGTVVTLTAAPKSGSTFTGWSGDCSGTAPTVSVTLTVDRSCSATFTAAVVPPLPSVLTVTLAGTTRGHVSSSPAGISCGLDCTESYANGTVVTLTAAPKSDSTFAGWTGDCSGSQQTVQVTLTADRSCTATFTQQAPQPKLCVTPLSVDFGTVVVGSSPTRDLTITNCGGGTLTGDLTIDPPFAGLYIPLGPFTLAAGESALATPTFDAPSLGPFSASVTVNSNGGTVSVPVTAVVVQLTYTLTVRKEGSGSGSVTSNPAGISCGADCSESYTPGTWVTLEVSFLQPGSTFRGWSGDCLGVPPGINVLMDADRTCIATFDLVPPSPPTISGISSGFPALNNCNTPGGTGSQVNVDFNYSDPNGDANKTTGATVRVEFRFSSGFSGSQDATSTSSFSGDGFNGQVTYRECVRFGTTSSIDFAFTLTDGAGHSSNPLSVTILRPEGAN